MEEGEVNELYDNFVRRVAEKLYPVPDQVGSDWERDRFEHKDLVGWSKTDILADLEALRIRRRLLPHVWLEEREVALQDALPRPRPRAARSAVPRPRRR